MTPLPRNPYTKPLDRMEISEDTASVVSAILALAHEQHQRNRLAAITAAHRGITLPTDLHDLTKEQTDE